MIYNVGEQLWKLFISIFKAMEGVWDFISAPIEIAKIEILGVTIVDGFTFNLLQGGGALLIVIITVGLISMLNPFS